MRNVWFVAVPILVTALWALVLWSPTSEPRNTVEAPPAAMPIEAVRRAPVLPAPAPLTTPAVVPPSAYEPEAPAQPTATPPTELPRLPPPTVQGPVNPLKSRYQSESATGSPPAQQQQLTAAFEGDVKDLLDNVECRRTVCRVRLAWMPKHGFSGMRLLAELRRDFDPNLAIDQAGPSGADRAQAVDVYIDLTSSRPKVP